MSKERYQSIRCSIHHSAEVFVDKNTVLFRIFDFQQIKVIRDWKAQNNRMMTASSIVVVIKQLLQFSTTQIAFFVPIVYGFLFHHR